MKELPQARISKMYGLDQNPDGFFPKKWKPFRMGEIDDPSLRILIGCVPLAVESDDPKCRDCYLTISEWEDNHTQDLVVSKLGPLETLLECRFEFLILGMFISIWSFQMRTLSPEMVFLGKGDFPHSYTCSSIGEIWVFPKIGLPPNHPF